MQLGDGSLRWVVLDLCRSLQVGHVNEEKIGQDPTALSSATPPGQHLDPLLRGGPHHLRVHGAVLGRLVDADRGARFGRRAGAGRR